MTSQNLLSKCFSLESLKVRVTCGFISLALQTRWTVALETPRDLAMLRVDHRVRLAGGCVARTIIFSRIFGLGGDKALPPPGVVPQPAPANGTAPSGTDGNQDPRKKKGFFGKIAGVFSDDKSSKTAPNRNVPRPPPPQPDNSAPPQ